MKTIFTVNVKVESVNEYYEFQSNEEREKFIEMVTQSFPNAQVIRKDIETQTDVNK
ncbi:MAG: hypothetical protein H6622_16385 [Halobacteriovoraceae bacterium]|nr:hypothetical protein [Halobacteriovoraceae bacterium]